MRRSHCSAAMRSSRSSGCALSAESACGCRLAFSAACSESAAFAPGVALAACCASACALPARWSASFLAASANWFPGFACCAADALVGDCCSPALAEAASWLGLSLPFAPEGWPVCAPALAWLAFAACCCCPGEVPLCCHFRRSGRRPCSVRNSVRCDRSGFDLSAIVCLANWSPAAGPAAASAAPLPPPCWPVHPRRRDFP